jgi:hypothetical protein
LAGTRLLNTSGVRKEKNIEQVIAGMLQKLSFVVCWRQQDGRAWLEFGATRSNANESIARRLSGTDVKCWHVVLAPVRLEFF